MDKVTSPLLQSGDSSPPPLITHVNEVIERQDSRNSPRKSTCQSDVPPNYTAKRKGSPINSADRVTHRQSKLMKHNFIHANGYHSEPPHPHYLGGSDEEDSDKPTDIDLRYHSNKELKEMLHTTVDFRDIEERTRVMDLLIISHRDFVAEGWILQKYMELVERGNLQPESMVNILFNLEHWIDEYGVKDFKSQKTKQLFHSLMIQIKVHDDGKTFMIDEMVEKVAHKFTVKSAPEDVVEEKSIAPFLKVSFKDYSFLGESPKFHPGICAKLIDSLFVDEFLKVSPVDLLEAESQNEDHSCNRCEALNNCLKNSKTLKAYVLSVIATGESENTRGSRIMGFIEIANVLHRVFSNYDATFSIMWALQDHKVKRLEGSWNEMQKAHGVKVLARFERLRKRYKKDSFQKLCHMMRHGIANNQRAMPSLMIFRKQIRDTFETEKQQTNRHQINKARYDKVQPYVKMIGTSQRKIEEFAKERKDPLVREKKYLDFVREEFISVKGEDEIKVELKKRRKEENKKMRNLAKLYVFFLGFMAFLDNGLNLFIFVKWVLTKQTYWAFIFGSFIALTYMFQMFMIWSTDYSEVSPLLYKSNKASEEMEAKKQSFRGKTCEIICALTGLATLRAVIRIYLKDEMYYMDEDVEDFNSTLTEFSRIHAVHVFFQSCVLGAMKLYIIFIGEETFVPSPALEYIVYVSSIVAGINILNRTLRLIRVWQALLIKYMTTAFSKRLLMFLFFVLLGTDFVLRTVSVISVYTNSNMIKMSWSAIIVAYEFSYSLIDYCTTRKSCDPEDLQYQGDCEDDEQPTFWERMKPRVLVLIKTLALCFTMLPHLHRDVSRYWLFEHCGRMVISVIPILYQWHFETHAHKIYWYIVISASVLAHFIALFLWTHILLIFYRKFGKSSPYHCCCFVWCLKDEDIPSQPAHRDNRKTLYDTLRVFVSSQPSPKRADPDSKNVFIWEVPDWREASLRLDYSLR